MTIISTENTRGVTVVFGPPAPVGTPTPARDGSQTLPTRPARHASSEPYVNRVPMGVYHANLSYVGKHRADS